MPDSAVDRRVRREERPELLRWIALARSLAATLDRLERPLLLIEPGPSLRVWHANAAAREQLADGEAVYLRDGLLHACGEANATALHRAVQALMAHLPTSRMVVPVQLRAGATTVGARLQRLDFGASADLPVAEVLLVEVEVQASPQRTVQRLRDGFGLTPREAECALGLYTIGSLDAVARCTGRSIHTVRTQLKAAMQKTSTHTQAGLVALVARQLER